MFSPPQFSFVRSLLKQKTGVVIDDSKVYLVVARLMPIVRQRKIPSLDSLVDRLRAGSDQTLQRDVLNAMMTHETSFFRDRSPFATLQKLIPELVKQRAATKQLCFWSAACSSGQEPYSIAILFNEYFRDLLSTWRIRIIATDISDVVLDRCRAGTYSELEVLRGLSPNLLKKYFTPLQGQWSISQECRKLVEFRRMNLHEAWPMMPFVDIVFLRNVLLYFDLPTRASIIQKMRRVVKPDGALFLGGAETMLGIDDTYQRIAGVGCSYYRPKL